MKSYLSRNSVSSVAKSEFIPLVIAAGLYGGLWVLSALAAPSVKPTDAPDMRPVAEARGEMPQPSDAVKRRLGRWGFPEGTVLFQGRFALAHDGRTRTPRWTLEYLDREVMAGPAQRRDCFRIDPRIAAEFRATNADYLGSGYDRGHAACAANYGDQAERDATFLLSNMMPETPKLNRGPMAATERHCRALAVGHSVWVGTAPAFVPDEQGVIEVRVIGESQAWVPTHVVKVVLVVDDEGWSGEAVMLSNTDDPLASRISIDEAERITGLDFFDRLPDDVEADLEAAE